MHTQYSLASSCVPRIRPATLRLLCRRRKYIRAPIRDPTTKIPTPALRPNANATVWLRLTCIDLVASTGISEPGKGTIVWASGASLLRTWRCVGYFVDRVGIYGLETYELDSVVCEA